MKPSAPVIRMVDSLFIVLIVDGVTKDVGSFSLTCVFQTRDNGHQADGLL